MSRNSLTSQVRLADDSTSTFLLRWRGKQEGPYTAAVIESKLAANQLGLLHEISHNGQWVTLRDYLAEREAVSLAARQAREEQERTTREDAERQARAREDDQRLAALAEANRNIHSPSIDQAPVRPPSPNPTASIYAILLKTTCLVSLLAFFLPNVTIALPILGKIDISMLDFLASQPNQSNSSRVKPEKPSVRNIGNLKVSKLTVGGALCAVSLLALLLHYLGTVAWGILTFVFRKTHSAFDLVWLSLGLQFPILFSIAVHITLAGVKSDVTKQSGNSDADAVGTLLGLAFVNNTNIGPGVVMWILMALALLAVGVNAVQQSSRS
jgi:hypothetical protein